MCIFLCFLDSLVCLTHISLVCHFWDTGKQCRPRSGKQCRPRSDTAKCGIWSGSLLFANMNIYLKQIKNEKVHQTSLKVEMDSSNWKGWMDPLRKCGLKYRMLLWEKGHHQINWWKSECQRSSIYRTSQFLPPSPDLYFSCYPLLWEFIHFIHNVM